MSRLSLGQNNTKIEEVEKYFVTKKDFTQFKPQKLTFQVKWL